MSLQVVVFTHEVSRDGVGDGKVLLRVVQSFLIAANKVFCEIIISNLFAMMSCEMRNGVFLDDAGVFPNDSGT